MLIAHSADNHLGCRRYSSATLQADYLKAAQRVVEESINRNADVLLLAGDLLHASRTTATNPFALKQLHTQAQEGGLIILAINGNHDRGEVSWAKVIEDEPLQDGDTVSKPGLYCVSGLTVTVKGADGTECRVHGCAVAGKQDLKDYLFTP